MNSFRVADEVSAETFRPAAQRAYRHVDKTCASIKCPQADQNQRQTVEEQVLRLLDEKTLARNDGFAAVRRDLAEFARAVVAQVRTLSGSV